MQEPFSWNSLEIYIDFFAGKFFVLGQDLFFFDQKSYTLRIFIV